MDTYFITGGRRLSGTVPVHGSKNSVLPILSAAILARGECVIHNCPDLSDVSATGDILKSLGCTLRRQGTTVMVDASALGDCAVPDFLMQRLRSSVLFLGALLARHGEAALCFPGGCELGPRPIDLHLKALSRLGANVMVEEGRLLCQRGKLSGSVISLPFPSVGATENAMLAACGAEGTTVICNAAREPEIVDLQRFLRAMGAEVRGAGGSAIVIEGGRPLHACEYTVMSDRIVAATYLSAVAAAGGEAELLGADCRTLGPVSAALTEAGCEIRSEKDKIWIKSEGCLRGIRPVYTAPYPGFPTDAQPMLMAALCGGTGDTLFVENIFAGRYSHVPSLQAMGADIALDGRQAEVRGTGGLHGTSVEARDLRGGAALVVAALGAQGDSVISGLSYMDRGYDGLDLALRSMGAHMTRKTQPKTDAPEYGDANGMRLWQEDGQKPNIADEAGSACSISCCL